MDIITSIDFAPFLLHVKEIVVDIETSTKAPSSDWGDKFGLSYCAPITYIALHAAGFPTLVLDWSEPTKEEHRFVRNVLSRSDIRIIGHNVVFDLRQLGGHLGFRIAPGVEVWDTMTMSQLLLMADNKGSLSLEALTSKYNLLVTDEEKMFQARMKGERKSLHESDPEDVKRYVAQDVVVTWRLYRLQQEVIACSEDRSAEPRSTLVDGQWALQTVQVTDRVNKFLPTKSWPQLPELVGWEFRKLRLCANMAIRGVKLDVDYVYEHINTLTKQYSDALKRVLSMKDPTHTEDFERKMALAVYAEQYLDALRNGTRPPNPGKWYYFQTLVGDDMSGIMEEGDWWFGFPTQNPAEYEYYGEWVEFLIDLTNGVDSLVLPKSTAPVFDLQHWVYRMSEWPEESRVLNYRKEGDDLDENWTEELPEGEPLTERHYQVNWWRARLKTDWFRHYFMQTRPIEPSKLVNKNLYQPYFVFVVCETPVPTIDDILNLPSLLTPKLKKLLDDGEEIDYVRAALDDNAFSMGEDALNFYFRSDDDDDAGEHPFITVNAASAKITRANEFLRHAEKDGRIHSLIVPRTRTSRAASSAMNLQNLNMADFAGYLVPDSDDRLFGGIDVSNAENWFAALTFADNELALACASSDFHWEMMKAYWFSSPAGQEQFAEYERIMREGGEQAHEVFSMLKKLRKKSKFVTFGSAYGAGPRKIASMVKCSYDEAKQLLANRDIRFSKYAAGKKQREAKVEQCYKDGNRPPYTVLWTGRRVPIDVQTRTKTFFDANGEPYKKTVQQVAGYRAANYLQQGGVAEMIWRAMVLADEYFEANQIDVNLALQIHDEIVIDAPIDIFWQAAQKVIEIIAEVVPEPIRNRTVPASRFLSELGPENATKWGYRHNKPYPLPLDKFVNRWGVWDMPEGAEEAPTWPGPLHEGYTVEGEIAQRQLERLGLAEEGQKTDEHDVLMENLNRWHELEGILEEMNDLVRQVNQYRVPGKLLIDGKVKGPFRFCERMVIHQDLYHRGMDPEGEYHAVLGLLDELREKVKAYEQWFSYE